MAERVSQVVAEVLTEADPTARVSQVVAEALTETSPTARVSQVVAEVLEKSAENTRVSQIVTEVLVGGGSNQRISQVVVEILLYNIEAFMPILYPDLPGLGYSCHWKPKAWNMPTTTMQTGARIDLGWSEAPLHDFELTYNFLRGKSFQQGSTEFRKMMGFFLALNGNLGRFLFKNPDDFSVTNQLVGTTDGITHTWQLQRTFGVEEYTGTEAVGYVDLTQPFNVYLEGVLQPKSSYTVVQTEPVNQILDFSGTPTTGKQIRVDMSYFYYCNLPDDSLDFEKFMNDLWLLKTVKFSSNRAGT